MNYLKTNGKALGNVFVHSFVAAIAIHVPLDVFDVKSDIHAILVSSSVAFVATMHLAGKILSDYR